MKMLLSSTALVAMMCGLWPLAAVAQNEPIRTQPPAQVPLLDPARVDIQQPKSSASSADAQIAACLIVDNQNEIALSQIALQRAQSDEVKKFAQQMIDDHQKMAGTLQPFATANSAAQGSAPGQPGAVAQAKPQGNVTTALKVEAFADPSGGGLDLVSLKRELGAQCLQSKRQELEQKQGAEFDMCFTGMQIAGHMGVVDELQVFQKYASSELRSKLAEAQKTAQGHLDHAKQIAKSQMASFQSGNQKSTSR